MVALYQCTWRWPGVGDAGERSRQFARAFLVADREVPELQGMVRAWYTYPGEWAGLLIVEAERPEDLVRVLNPFNGLMTWEVKPLLAQDYAETKRRLSQQASQG